MQARLVSNWIRTPLLLLLLVEATILYSSLYVAGLVCFGSVELCAEVFGPLAPRALFVTSIALVSLIAMGLYQFHQRFWLHEAVARLLVGLFIAALIISVVFYALPGIAIDRDVASIAFGYSLLMLLGVRFYFVKTVDENVFRRRTLVFGAGERASNLLDLRRRADRRGFRIVGRIAAPGDTIVGDRSEVLMINGRSITDFARERDADEIVIAMDERRGNLPVKQLLEARFSGVGVIDLIEFFERETGKIRIDLVNPGWLIFSPGFRISKVRHYSQRMVDVLVSGCMFALTWPLMLLVVLAIKLEDGIGAPVFYKQQRVGALGKVFDVIKFRSMRENAEADGKAVWATKNDSRVTLVGSFLRVSRLDELPQVFNVLKGEMSLVGPRPERPEFVDQLKEKIPYYAERHSVKPGITGWAQLKYSYGASEEDAAEKLMYDLYYIKNQSLLLDLLILIQTVEVILWGKGAR